MTDTLEQLAAEVTAANDDLHLGNHANDLQRLREMESDREDLIERINAREDRLQVARDALLHFVAPEAQPEPNATVEPPESAGEAFNAAFQQTEAADAWTPEPREMLAEIAGPTDPNAPMSGVETMLRGDWAVKPAPDDQPDTEPDHIHRNGAADHSGT